MKLRILEGIKRTIMNQTGLVNVSDEVALLLTRAKYLQTTGKKARSATIMVAVNKAIRAQGGVDVDLSRMRLTDERETIAKGVRFKALQAAVHPTVSNIKPTVARSEEILIRSTTHDTNIGVDFKSASKAVIESQISELIHAIETTVIVKIDRTGKTSRENEARANRLLRKLETARANAISLLERMTVTFETYMLLTSLDRRIYLESYDSTIEVSESISDIHSITERGEGFFIAEDTVNNYIENLMQILQ